MIEKNKLSPLESALLFKLFFPNDASGWMSHKELYETDIRHHKEIQLRDDNPNKLNPSKLPSELFFDNPKSGISKSDHYKNMPKILKRLVEKRFIERKSFEKENPERSGFKWRIIKSQNNMDRIDKIFVSKYLFNVDTFCKLIENKTKLFQMMDDSSLLKQYYKKKSEQDKKMDKLKYDNFLFKTILYAQKTYGKHFMTSLITDIKQKHIRLETGVELLKKNFKKEMEAKKTSKI